MIFFVKNDGHGGTFRKIRFFFLLVYSINFVIFALDTSLVVTDNIIGGSV